ncbi:MAG: hypothetical protein IT371_23435 [Deltaproteobacteria bacterium]|nr:hypothetical protein [Deltaproteobacteria bacterium]
MHLKNGYCHSDFGCGAQGGGVCKTRPSSCTGEYLPVCGCDNVTYSNPCGANANGVSVASRGACSPTTTSCDQLSAAYQVAVKQGKSCNAALSSPQCTVMVPDSLQCGCMTMVDSRNTLAVQAITYVQQLWKQQGCLSVPCTKPCRPVQAGICVAGSSGTAGTCQDRP